MTITYHAGRRIQGLSTDYVPAITDVSDHQNHHEENPLLPPLLRTNSVTSFEYHTVNLSGKLLSSGNNPELDFGFQISTSIFFDDVQEIIIEGFFEDGDLLTTTFDFSEISANKLFFRVFARNELFESFGNKKRIILPKVVTPEETVLFPGAIELENQWKENWLGVFKEHPNGWIYHLDLDWCFASPTSNGGVWLWTKTRGWLWATKQTWPHIYINQTSSWFYLVRSQSGPTMIFDYAEGKFSFLK